MQQQFITVEQVKINILFNVFDKLVELHGAVQIFAETQGQKTCFLPQNYPNSKVIIFIT